MEAATLWVHHALHVPREMSIGATASGKNVPIREPDATELAIFVEFFRLLYAAIRGNGSMLSLEHGLKKGTKRKGKRGGVEPNVDNTPTDCQDSVTSGTAHARPTHADSILVASAAAFLHRECKKLGIDYRPDLWKPLEECNGSPDEDDDAMSVEDNKGHEAAETSMPTEVASDRASEVTSKTKAKMSRKERKRRKSEASLRDEMVEEDADVEDNGPPLHEGMFHYTQVYRLIT